MFEPTLPKFTDEYMPLGGIWHFSSKWTSFSIQTSDVQCNGKQIRPDKMSNDEREGLMESKPIISPWNQIVSTYKRWYLYFSNISGRVDSIPLYQYGLKEFDL